MLTVARCEEMILHTLGDLASTPEAFSTKEVVDRAGRWLCSAHPWTWLTRLGTLDVSASFNYVSLAPLGAFTALRRVVYTDSTANYLCEASLETVLDSRVSLTPPGSPTRYALNTRIDGSTDVITRVLELDATPSDDASGALSILYRAGWQVPTARIPIPEEWESLYLLGVRSIARGYHFEDQADVNTRLSALQSGVEFQNLVRMDGMSQSTFGPLEGGGVEMQMVSQYQPRYPRSI